MNIIRLLLPCTALILPLTGFATSYSFSSTSSSLKNLSHGTAYTWGLNLTTLGTLESALHSGQHVTSATFTITNLYDWTRESSDVLYVNLLNGVKSGVYAYTYNANPSTNDTSYGPDFFNSTSSHLQYDVASAHSLLVYTGAYKNAGNPGTWSDPAGGAPTGFNLVINLTNDNLGVLNGFLSGDYGHLGSNSDLGFGFSPDCHYFDTGVSFVVNTARNVPESGATLALLTVGLTAVGFMRRTFRQPAKSA